MIRDVWSGAKNIAKDIMVVPKYIDSHDVDIETIKDGVIKYIESQSIGDYGCSFSQSAHEATLFASVYKLMIYGLIGVDIVDADGWKEYLDSFQDDDGIWRDKKHPFRNWAARSDEWNDIHLIPHIIYAYEAIKKLPNKRYEFLDKFKKREVISDFCEQIDFEKFWASSNGVMNYLVSMIYARDVMGDSELQSSIDYILSFLVNKMDLSDGLWTERRDKTSLYEAVRGGYHVWMLMIQEGVKFQENHIHNIIDTILLLQNKYGGYNKHLIADICHNIDCIDPLVRFSYMDPDYRKNEIEDALLNARRYLLNNRNDDGGFCFGRMIKLRYGNDSLRSDFNESNMFGTWFTLLALMIIEDYFDEKVLLESKLPGMEYKVKV